jgi:hypothetical protein
MRRPTKRWNRQGTSTVEAVITTAALTTLMIGMVDLGVGVFRTHNISEAARQGARQACVHGANANLLGSWGPPADSNPWTATGTSTDAKVTGLLPYLTGLDPSTVTITYQWPDNDNQVESRVQVTVSTTWSPMLTSLFGASAYNLSASSTMPIAH